MILLLLITLVESSHVCAIRVGTVCALQGVWTIFRPTSNQIRLGLFKNPQLRCRMHAGIWAPGGQQNHACPVQLCAFTPAFCLYNGALLASESALPRRPAFSRSLILAWCFHDGTFSFVLSCLLSLHVHRAGRFVLPVPSAEGAALLVLGGQPLGDALQMEGMATDSPDYRAVISWVLPYSA